MEHRSPTRGGDLDAVVSVLDQEGPCPLLTLHGEPELAGWTSARIERAVVAAWSAGLITVDRDDRLVAL